ncbi:putative capsule biosynthesis protein CapA [Firmicutes bacterium CAG:822]|nr:putative capsule biosynthesis protein CapA [Firmicutes bacterium CAG:822]
MKKKYVIFVVLIVLIFISGLYLLKKESQNEPKQQEKTEEVQKEETKTSKLSLIMVGDALLHGSVYRDAYKNGVYNFDSQLEYIKPIVQNYDLAFYNQESILGGTELGLSDYPTFNSPWEFGDAMINSGFNLVSLANNHTMDRGEKAVLNSCEYWKSKEDVLAVGSYCSKEDSEAIQIREKNGIKYTLLAYTYGTNGISVPQGKEYLVNLYSDEKVKNDIAKVRDKVDLLIVSMHWGTEYRTEPTEEQKREAEYLSSLGVDIIIGTHPHIIEPITYINDTLVIYSLGNFISAQSTNNDYNTMVELMTSVDIIKEEKDGQTTIKLDNLNNELLFNYYKKGSKWTDFKVVPFSQMNSSYNSDYQRLYNKYSAVVKMYNEDIPINPLPEA